MADEIERTEYATKCYRAALKAVDEIDAPAEFAHEVERLNFKRASVAFKRLQRYGNLHQYQREHIVATVLWVVNNDALSGYAGREDVHPFCEASQWLIGFANGFASSRLAPI